MSDLVGNPEDRFSHNEAQIMEKAVLLLWISVLLVSEVNVGPFFAVPCNLFCSMSICSFLEDGHANRTTN